MRIAQRPPAGQYGFHLPAEWHLQESWDLERAYFLDPAPLWRLLLLPAGYAGILARRRLRALRPRRRRSALAGQEGP
ncbi:MAG TPA: hypothetical protein VKY74_00925 [Chloroflexia bacterium]|nr:hypothetical protein [Chloroflexia bacterium]